MLRDALAFIANQYRGASTEQFTKHPVAQFVRSQLADEVRFGLGPSSRNFKVKGSAGQSDWAAVPWCAVFDPIVATGATHGFYVVYLFAADRPVVFISLNQGTTAVEREFGAARRDEVLRDRAAFMRARLPDFADAFDAGPILLGSRLPLPLGYEAGHVFGRAYDCTALPDEQDLHSDLREITRSYLALIYRGGLEPSPENTDDDLPKSGATLVEIRQYRQHRRIDRHPKAAKEAKKFHGTTCQACQMSFAERYGALGDGFIEAHHLKPLSSLEEGKPIEYDVATDFAVLCSNCHRMIHRSGDPSDIKAFRRLLKS
jgi:5-methylcytosine-specific restriction enzyme A